MSRHIGLCLQRGLVPIEGLTRYAAAVGSAHAAAFTTYVREASLPDPEEVLANAEKYKPTGRPDIDSTTLAAVAAVVEANLTLPRYLSGWQVIHCAAQRHDDGAPAHEAAMIAVLRLAKHLKPEHQPRLYGNATPKDKGRALQVLTKLMSPYADFLSKNGLKDLI